MKEISLAEQEQVLIVAYWPRTTHSELHVGYGIARKHRMYQWLEIIYNAVTRTFNVFFEPKIRPRSRWLLLVFSLASTAILVSLRGRHRRMTGYYQLDEQGKPAFYIGNFPPESIQRRNGVGRKKFLQYVAESK